jgi:hypothetical protein
MEPITLAVLLFGVTVVLLMTFLLFVYWRSLPFATGHVFTASRLSRGNRLFPTQVLITPTSVVHYTPQWLGKHEHSIHMAHVASVRIDTGVLFSDVFIETTGGENGIRCTGHRKGDAVEMKALVERFQSEYYRGHGSGSRPEPAAPAVG